MSSEMDEALSALGPVIQAYQVAVDDFDRETARILGVNRTDLRCIEALVDAGDAGMTPRELADRLTLTSGSVTTMLDRLGTVGYISRAPHPSDGRRLVVRLTPRARELVWDIIGPQIAEATATVSAEFSAEEIASVRSFLSTVTAVQQAHVDLLRTRDVV